MTVRANSLQSAFTLVELLVVIAVLGVLAASVLIAINPLEQLARGRDAGRISAVTQIGKAVQAYYTQNGSVYPTQLTDLQTSKDLANIPSNPGYNGGASGSYSYTQNANGAIVYAAAESKSSITGKCGATATTAYIEWASNAGATGVNCGTPATTDTLSNLK